MGKIRDIIENERITTPTKVGDAVNVDEALSKGQLVNTVALAGSNVALVNNRTPVALNSTLPNSSFIEQTGGSWIKNQCSAWVLFDGATGTIKDSFNMGSVVRNAGGDATLSFLSSMATTNYLGLAEADRSPVIAGAPLRWARVDSSTKTLTSVKVYYGSLSTTATSVLEDYPDIRVLFFGGK